MQRRLFLKTAYLGTLYWAVQPAKSFSQLFSEPPPKSKIVIAKNSNIFNSNNTLLSDQLEALLDNGMQSFFEVNNPIEAWKKVVKRGEVIGLKVNCLSGLGSTNVDLVYIICEKLQEAGIRKKDIDRAQKISGE